MYKGVCEYTCHSPVIKLPWKGMAFFTDGHPRGAGVSSSSGKSSKRVLGKAQEITFSNDTPCLLNVTP